MNKKIFYFVILIFLFSFLIRLLFSLTASFKFWDETIYANLGYNLNKYHEYSFEHGFADFAPDWPKAGFRAPLLPFIISIGYLIFKNNWFLTLISSLFGALGVAGLFLLTKELFDNKTAVYSSIFLALIPIEVVWTSRIMPESLMIFLIIFSIYFFYLAFFKKEKVVLFSSLFGIFLALAFLSKYSALWIVPILALSIFYKEKNLKFLIKKEIWISLFSFLIIILPWLIYSHNTYGNMFGFIIHANKSLSLWKKFEPWYFFFLKSKNIFSILLPFFVLGLFSMIKNKKYNKYSKFLILSWFFVILLFSISLAHKEERYILPLIPAFCIISSFGISVKKIEKYIFLSIIIILLIHLAYEFSLIYSRAHTEREKCFLNSMEFIKNSNASEVVTEWFSPVYFFTHKDNLRVRENYSEIEEIVKKNPEKEIYYFYQEGDWINHTNKTSKLIFQCGESKIFKLDN